MNLEESIKSVFERCYNFGHSQCALVLGPRGDSLKTKIQNCSEAYSPITLHLSGLLISEDLPGLQSLALQLAEAKGSNYTQAPLNPTLSFIKESLSSSDRVLVWIRDIQVFAKKQLKQILLYSLFELVHEELAQICVIGITPRLDFVEQLEKRIRSRFSYQTILNFEDIVLGRDGDLGRTGAKVPIKTRIEYIKLLKPIELVVLCFYARLHKREQPLTLKRVKRNYKEFTRGRSFVFKYDYFTLQIITNHLVKLKVLKPLNNPSKVEAHTEYSLNFEDSEFERLVRLEELEVPTSVKEWLIS
mmetsp:Transcript_8955/g.13370  ORF Transcript_8955/g.13370 Transcript_8955/m.13370 type:complete len:302 (-) Transcript_8955:24-929(-)